VDAVLGRPFGDGRVGAGLFSDVSGTRQSAGQAVMKIELPIKHGLNTDKNLCFICVNLWLK
jgi:hypothetical protein